MNLMRFLRADGKGGTQRIFKMCYFLKDHLKLCCLFVGLGFSQSALIFQHSKLKEKKLNRGLADLGPETRGRAQRNKNVQKAVKNNKIKPNAETEW